MVKRLVLFAALECGLATPVWAGTYWVGPTGAASWANCSGTTPLDGTSACALSTANNNAAAGDVVYLRGGTYLQTVGSGCGAAYVCGIFPRNRGVAGAPITFAAYSGETPIITAERGLTTSRGITISNGVPGEGTYIRVIGITFRNLYLWATLNNYASYNEIGHNTFFSETGQDFGGVAGLAINSLCTGGSSWTCYSRHNWIHHNSFSKVHAYGTSACREGADMIRIGIAYSSARDNANSMVQDDNNTVEHNVIAYAGHALMDTYGGFTVVKNNVWHNDGWIPDVSGGSCSFPPMPNGRYGHRGLQTTEDYARSDQWILVEGNRLGWGSANPNNPGDANYAIASPSTIVRYNYAYGSQQSGIGTKWYSACADDACARANRGRGGYGPAKIRIYNNTTYHNGWTYPYMQSEQPGCSTCPGKLAGINIYSLALDVVVKNNIAYGNYSHTLYGGDITVNSGKDPAAYPAAVTETNNWETPSGDPSFVNPSITDPTSRTLPDLSLRSKSGAIDGGILLTTAVESRSASTLLRVADARYFQDGTWGSALARGVTMFPDWVAVGSPSNVAEIAAIDYRTNTITLTSPRSWSINAPIYLYKNSDGAVVFKGAAPDIGAFEVEPGTPQPPTNVRVR